MDYFELICFGTKTNFSVGETLRPMFNETLRKVLLRYKNVKKTLYDHVI